MLEEAANCLNIAVDYDDTFSADPELFTFFIKAARHRGHDVRIVTGRSEMATSEVIMHLHKMGIGYIPVIATTYKAKDAFCKALGFPVAIWIDDHPSAIVEDNKCLQRTNFPGLW